MKKFKKIFASILAVSTMAISMTGISADASSWTLGFNSTSSSSSYKMCTVSIGAITQEQGLHIDSFITAFSGSSSKVTIVNSKYSMTHSATSKTSKYWDKSGISDIDIAFKITLYGNAGYSNAGGSIAGYRY